MTSVDSDRHPFRVHVSGLAKSAVHRQTGQEWYDEENAIGKMFHKHGCQVSLVSLLVDKRSGRSRGFAFVDFEDEPSFLKACGLNGLDRLTGTGLKLDEKSGGRLRISPAKPSDDSLREKQLELTGERDRTVGLEKEMRLCAARINELMEQIRAQKDRQLALQKSKRVEAELETQRTRQKCIEELMAELRAVESALVGELSVEREKTRALEDLHESDQLDEERPEPSEDDARAESSQIPKSAVAPEGSALQLNIGLQPQPQSLGESKLVLSTPPLSSQQLEAASFSSLTNQDEGATEKDAINGARKSSIDISDAKVDALEQCLGLVLRMLCKTHPLVFEQLERSMLASTGRRKKASPAESAAGAIAAVAHNSSQSFFSSDILGASFFASD